MRTTAGRELYNAIPPDSYADWHEWIGPHIEAIQDQAAAAERADLREVWADAQRRYMSRMHDVGHMAELVDGMLAEDASG